MATITIPQRLRQLERVHHGTRKAAAAHGIDPGYWVRLRNGEKTDPSEDTLVKLGLMRVVSYRLRGEGAASDAAIRQALLDGIEELRRPGKYSTQQLAEAAGLPTDLKTAHAIGRAMDDMGFVRFRSSNERGFVLPVTNHHPVTVASH